MIYYSKLYSYFLSIDMNCSPGIHQYISDKSALACKAFLMDYIHITRWELFIHTCTNFNGGWTNIPQNIVGYHYLQWLKASLQ